MIGKIADRIDTDIDGNTFMTNTVSVGVKNYLTSKGIKPTVCRYERTQKDLDITPYVEPVITQAHLEILSLYILRGRRGMFMWRIPVTH